jgi:hypothetical protein
MLIGVCVVFLVVSTSEAQTIYKWEDARGILHYSDAQQTPRAKRLKRNALPSFGNNVVAAIPTAEEPAAREILTTSTTPPSDKELPAEAMPPYNELLAENDQLLRLMANVITTSPEVGWMPQPLPVLAWPQGWLAGTRQFWLTGDVYNLGQGVCENPAVEVTVFDDTGTVTGTFETAAEVDILEWEEQGQFEGQGVTPIGESLAWEAVPRCSTEAGDIYGPRQRGSLNLAGDSRVWWGQRYRMQ